MPRRMRRLGVLTTSVLAGLSFAHPALASDDIEPVVPLLPPEVVSGTIPALDPTQAQLEDPPAVVTVTQTETGSLNVSVRVLSPGTDGPVTQEDPASSLVSDVLAPDITGDSDTAAPGAATGSPEPASASTNVSVRVLSLGDNGAVNQSNAAAVPEAGGIQRSGPSSTSSSDHPPAATPVAASGGDESTSPEINSEQYHDSLLQYQSPAQSSNYSWTWLWKLTLDCAGNTTSSSTAIGSEASLNWAWNWMWDWGCDTTDASDASSTGSSADAPSSEATVSPPQGDASTMAPTGTTAEPPSAPAPVQSELSSGIWVWTWAFTHCGRTTSLSSTTSSQTPLTWTWDWIWSWTCPTAGGVSTDSSPPASDAAPLTGPSPFPAALPEPNAQISAPRAVAPDLPLLPLLLPLTPLPLPPVAEPTELLVPPVETTIEVTLPELVIPLQEVSIPLPTFAANVEPVVVVAVPAPAARAGNQPPRGHPTKPALDTGSVPVPQPTTEPAWRQPPGHSSDSRTRTRPTIEARPQSAPPRAPRDRSSPFDLPSPLQAVGSAGASSGVGPSGLLVLVAALTGHFVFAAPALGRRIRIARGLSPRSRHRSPIDDPG